MSAATEPRSLILETSCRSGFVAVARGAAILESRRLDEARRHARDLTPAIADLLTEQGWRPCEVEAVIVSRGPGSYTGLRVGVMSAKAFAYATGCALLAVDTFAAVAGQAPPEASRIVVIADAQQQRVYWQQFARSAPGSVPPAASELAIVNVADAFAEPDPTTWVSGPGLRVHAARLPVGWLVAPEASWEPQPASLLQRGLARFARGERDEVWSLEPLYLRPSSAEEQWDRRGRK
jgi:tRNA threonylcarbamoyladenosine biosynthesis protein TsaB